MKKYYADISVNQDGKTLVHKEGCVNLPDPAEREYLGVFSGCYGAVLEAKRRYDDAEGCVLCAFGCYIELPVEI